MKNKCLFGTLFERYSVLFNLESSEILVLTISQFSVWFQLEEKKAIRQCVKLNL